MDLMTDGSAAASNICGPQALEQKLKDVRCPVLAISGQDDPLVPPSNGEYLKRHLPNCRAEVMAAGHLVWEDDPQTYAGLVSAWITGGYNSLPRF
jgi:pimeloyl-ACP methyl ester carboxylesterase